MANNYFFDDSKNDVYYIDDSKSFPYLWFSGLVTLITDDTDIISKTANRIFFSKTPNRIFFSKTPNRNLESI